MLEERILFLFFYVKFQCDAKFQKKFTEEHWFIQDLYLSEKLWLEMWIWQDIIEVVGEPTQ